MYAPSPPDTHTQAHMHTHTVDTSQEDAMYQASSIWTFLEKGIICCMTCAFVVTEVMVVVISVLSSSRWESNARCWMTC